MYVVAHAFDCNIKRCLISEILLRFFSVPEMLTLLNLFFQWLNEKELIESIISLINDRYDQDVHDNASRLIIEIFKASGNGQVCT